MREQTAVIAIRALSVDVANLMARTAVLNANLETIATIRQGIDPNQWVVDSNGDDPPETITLPVAEVLRIRELLEAVDGVG